MCSSDKWTVASSSGANKYFIDGVQQDTLDLYSDERALGTSI